MIYNNFSKQLNIPNHNTINRKYYATNNISFSSLKKDVFVSQQGKRISKTMYDKGTEIKNAIEYSAKSVYNQRFTPPVALSNLLYHDMTKLGFWEITTDPKELKADAIKAKEMFPNSKLIPFAKSDKTDNIAYFDISSLSIVEKEGDIEIAQYDTFEDWVFSAIEDIFASYEFLENSNEEVTFLEDRINSTSENKFKCPTSYRQAKALNLARFLDRWSMPNLIESDLINYSSGTVVPFACSDSGNTFAAFMNKGNENQNIIVGTIYPKDRKEYANTKNDSLITVLEHYDSFEDWFKNQMQKILKAETY